MLSNNHEQYRILAAGELVGDQMPDGFGSVMVPHYFRLHRHGEFLGGAVAGECVTDGELINPHNDIALPQLPQETADEAARRAADAAAEAERQRH